MGHKLPHITALFWAMKIVAVTLGETAGDLVGITLKTGYVLTELLFLGYFVTVLALQVTANRFRPAIYWAVVVGTSLVGTEMSDLIDRGPGYGGEANGIGYGWGALALTGALAIIFLVWWRTGETYDVENMARLRPHPPAWCRRRRLPHQTGRRRRPRLGHRVGLRRLCGLLIALIAYPTGRIRKVPLNPLPDLAPAPHAEVAAGGRSKVAARPPANDATA